jgi:cell division septum initiation protein DivIVA
MLNTSPDAPKEIVSMKFTGLRSSAELVGDEEVLRFLDACAQAFPGLLTENTANRDERSKEQ